MERSGLHSVFRVPWAYSFFQGAIGARRSSKIIAAEYLSKLFASDGSILDIGCGPAQFLADNRGIDASRYLGIEPNELYLRVARSRFPKARFLHGTTRSFPNGIDEDFDYVLISGVLHHLTDDEVASTLAFAWKHLRASGVIFTIDPVFTSPQNPIARILASRDRGEHIRTVDEYDRLSEQALGVAPTIREVRTDLLRVPYSHYITVTSR